MDGFDFSAVPGLFAGMDQDQLRALLAAYMPNEEDKRTSRGQAAMMAGFAALANPYRGQEMQALGNAGMAGLASYRQGLRDATAERSSALTQAMGAQKLLRESQTADLVSQVLARRMGRTLPGMPGATPAPAASSSGFTPGGTVADAMTGGARAPMPATGGTAGSGSGMPGPGDDSTLDELALAAAGKKDMADVLWRHGEIKVSQNGDIYRGSQLVGRTTNAGTVWKQPDGSWRLDAMPQDVLDAVARQEANVAGVKAGAEARARNRYTVGTADRGGTKESGYITDLYGDPDAAGAAPAQPAAAPAAPGRISAQFNFQNARPEEVAAALRDAQGAGAPAPAGGGTRVARGMSAGEQAALEVDTAGRKKSNEAIVDEVKASAGVANTARAAIDTIHEARRALDTGKVISGAGADWRLAFARGLSLAGDGNAAQQAAATQEFAATQGRQVLGVIKSLGSGSGISDADREYAAKIVGGQIPLEEASMRKLLDISERAQRALIAQHGKRTATAARALSNPALSDFFGVEDAPAYVRPEPMAPANAQPAGGAHRSAQPVETINGQRIVFPSVAAWTAWKRATGRQ